MGRFWVVGGRYRDTRFTNMAEGVREERYGPFMRYDDAKAEWQNRSWSQVDDCLVRYRIVEEAMAQ